VAHRSLSLGASSEVEMALAGIDLSVLLVAQSVMRKKRTKTLLLHQM
jgi:hypothetical protein